MYSFAQRSDTEVIDEPFYAVYLERSGALHPGKEEVIAHMPTDEYQVRENIAQTYKKPVLFVKNMAHHMEVLDDPWLAGAVNVFLIRNPGQIIASYAQVIEKPVMRDIGLQYQYNLFKQLHDKGEQCHLLDTGLLLENPEAVLRKLCEKCHISFEQRMLHWPKGPKSYDGIWAKYWYENVHQSTGFEKQTTSSRPLPASLTELYESAKVFYEKLLPFSLKA